MKLSEHFTLQEFLRSATAKKFKVKNEATDEHFQNMKALCNNVLEPIRAIFRKPVNITSGFRSQLLNKTMGENGYYVSKFSQHCKGEAADFYIADASNDAIIKAVLTNGIIFDQLINETAYSNCHLTTWIHISYKRNGHNRKQILRMHNGKYV